MDKVKVTKADVIKLPKGLNPAKASGPDEVRSRVLKELPNEIGTIFSPISFSCPWIMEKLLKTGPWPTLSTTFGGLKLKIQLEFFLIQHLKITLKSIYSNFNI